MWQELAKIVAHAAVHSALKRRQAEALAEQTRAAGGDVSTPEAAASGAHDASTARGPGGVPAPKKRAGIAPSAIVLAVLGSCCLFTGIASLASNTQRALSARTPAARDEALGGIGYGFALCIFPSAAMLGIAALGVRRTRAMRTESEPATPSKPSHAAGAPAGGRPWSGTCPFCRTAVAVVLVPGVRAKCPSCRAGLGVVA